ncbi:cysteine hydrolase family protein [Nocardia sp. alder85J]|uniref:cysteine hydrolase family protein n=1 Tax=Nocardia sp. alder85J TaxID=2862949 RepID=UPI001CD36019|nr:isochorismatase family cysteine hydrolase [Nocardia sp. alder85J]MCX4095606.1 cysteine hydrolase [Nocardia sp. alder85J]
MTAPKQALLLLDPTDGTVRSNGSFARLMDPGTDFDRLTDRLRTALQAARTAGVPVIWVVPGAAFIEQMTGEAPAPSASRPDEIVGVPAPDEPLVEKTAIGAFPGNDLERILRAAGIDEIVLAGVATQYVVAATAREGRERGFTVRILQDACADLDPATHARTLDALRPIATITWTPEDWSDLPARN